MKPRQEPNETSQTNQATKPKPIQSPSKDRKGKCSRIGKAMAKKVIPYILVGCIASSAVMMSFNEAEEVKAEAISITALTVCALLAVMATMGITYATQNILETWEDGNNALDPDYEDIYDTWKEGYNAEWKLLEGGGDNNEDLPPDFDILMKQIEIAGNTAVITANAWNLLKKSGKTFLQKSYELGTLFADATIPDGMNVPIDDISATTAVIFHSNTGKLCSKENSYNMIYDTKMPVCFYENNMLYICGLDYKDSFSRVYDSKGNLIEERGGLYVTGFVTKTHTYKKIDVHKQMLPHVDTYMSKYPEFETLEEAKDYMNQYIDKQLIDRQDEPIWVTPELQDTYKNKGQFEFPENLPNPLRVPNIGDLQELAKRLNPDSNPDYNPEEIPEYIKQYINNLKVDPKPDPEPNPDPTPDPDNPDKPVNPDNPDIPTNNDTFLADLKHLFPFCIPFDLVDCFKLFNAEPVTPRVEFPVHFGIINYDHTFVIDLKDFNNVAVVCRSTFLIIYITGLILATRALIKG